MILQVTAGAPFYFDDWDIPLSSVFQGPASISIDPSIVVPNHWTVMPADFCYDVGVYEWGVNDKIGVGFDIDTPWNVYDNGSTYDVPSGWYGILVINPWTYTLTGTAQTIIDPNCYCEGAYWSGPGILNNWQAHIRRPDLALGPGVYVGGTISFLTSATTPIPCALGPCSHS
jgi:hypothetical protein